MSNRRPRIDSVDQQVAVMAAANRPISAPSNVPLDEREMAFFSNVIDEFARSEWTAHQLELAALLARNMAALEEAQRAIKTEGAVIDNARGNPVQNPLLGYIRAMDSSILAHRRSLSLNATARPTDKGDIGKRRAMAKEAEAGSFFDDEDLLARPQ